MRRCGRGSFLGAAAATAERQRRRPEGAGERGLLGGGAGPPESPVGGAREVG